MNVQVLQRATLTGSETVPATWTRARLAGRLTEISSRDGAALLTLAFALVLDAQQQGETCAWIGRSESCFFPPDVAACGVDLDALAVIRVSTSKAITRCADRLLHSGALGLVILDLGHEHPLPPAGQSRLAGLAKAHDTALVCLTRKQRDSASMGPLVSVRAQAQCKQHLGGGYTCEALVLKDKGRSAHWSHVEECCGPPGLC